MQIDIKVNGNVGNIPNITGMAVNKVFTQVISRGMRAANALRNAELHVLSGQRGGATQRKAYTRNATYTGSAPGEPPAVRSGNLRRNWRMAVENGGGGGGVSIKPTLYSDTHYAIFLDEGTRKMAARPFKKRIQEEAMPEVVRIYSEPYL